MGDPTLTHGEVRVQQRAETWDKHVENNHTHSADKHTDAHMLLPIATQPSKGSVFVITLCLVMLLPLGVHVTGKCTLSLEKRLTNN